MADDSTLPGNLYHAKTVRVIGIGVSVDAVVTLGGADVTLAVADADPNGVVIAHVRGVLTGDAPAGTVASYTEPLTASSLSWLTAPAAADRLNN